MFKACKDKVTLLLIAPAFTDTEIIIQALKKIKILYIIFRTPLPKDSTREMELKAEQTAREIEQVSHLLKMC